MDSCSDVEVRIVVQMLRCGSVQMLNRISFIFNSQQVQMLLFQKITFSMVHNIDESKNDVTGVNSALVGDCTG